jgi:hypothetical protein
MGLRKVKSPDKSFQARLRMETNTPIAEAETYLTSKHASQGEVSGRRKELLWGISAPKK